MLYCKINSCLIYNSQTNMLNEILCPLSPFLQEESLGAVLFQPVYGANFQCTQTFLVAFHLRPCNFHLGL